LKGFLPRYDTPYSTAFTATNASASDPIKRNTPPPPTSAIDPIYTQVKAPFLRDDRPALLVSSTSWTPDEDFSILIAALEKYNARAAASNKKLPKLLVILTGKGPLKEKYMSEVGELQKKWDWVRCISMWLEVEDYPTLLGIRFFSLQSSCMSEGSDRCGGFRDKSARQLLQPGFADEGGRHVWLCPTRLCSRLQLVRGLYLVEGEGLPLNNPVWMN
jgi:hypothetical protein